MLAYPFRIAANNGSKIHCSHGRSTWIFGWKKDDWLVVWNIFSYYMGCHPSHWRTPSFFKMVKTCENHQPEHIPFFDISHDIIPLYPKIREKCRIYILYQHIIYSHAYIYIYIYSTHVYLQYTIYIYIHHHIFVMHTSTNLFVGNIPNGCWETAAARIFECNVCRPGDV